MSRITFERGFPRRLAVLLGALVALVLVGTVGFAVIESVSLGYGFEWTVDTLTTVGAVGDPRDVGGRILRVVLELLGIGTLFYGLATVAEFFVSGELSGVLGRRRAQKMIDSLRDHFIVCGYGRVGRQVVRDLHDAAVDYVVVDSNPEALEQARADGVPLIEGQAADDEVLLSAGLERAKGVLACVDSDADNIFITLSARELRGDVTIIARASAEDSEKKLLRAGADRIISPYKTSGAAMARVALHPQVGGAVQLADYRVEEIEVPGSCRAVGQRIADVRGLSAILAVRGVDGVLDVAPAVDRVIAPGDMLVAVGTPDTLEGLEALFQPRDGVGG